MGEWWETFFGQDYLQIAAQMFTEEQNTTQAAELWSMLELNPGCRLLDAPCGWGRLSRPLALLGAAVLGVDQSESLIAAAESQRRDLLLDQLRYLRHDLRTPIPESDFDVACNIFTSFGYGTERTIWPCSGRCEMPFGKAGGLWSRPTIATWSVRSWHAVRNTQNGGRMARCSWMNRDLTPSPGS